ncbi:Phosphatidic acid phosphatase PAP2 superfamily protein [Gammaproteobacteria bacterium]
MPFELEETRQPLDWRLPAVLALSFALAALVLYLEGGYHAGFIPLNRFLGQWPDSLWSQISAFGEAEVVLPLGLWLGWRHPRLLVALALAAILGGLVAPLLKWFFHTPRPPAVLPVEVVHLIGPVLRRNGFPSGHTLSAFAASGVMGMALPAAWRWVVLMAAGLVGLSRVAMGVHWPLDVLAGASLGLLLAAWALWQCDRWRAGISSLQAVWVILVLLLGAGFYRSASEGLWLPALAIATSLVIVVWRIRQE